MPTLNARTTTVTLFQGDDFDRELELRKALEVAAVNASNPQRLGDSPGVKTAAAEYDAFVAEAAERGVTLTLRALKRTAWREMVGKHPAREDNIEDSQWGFNVLAMADDLVPASVPVTENGFDNDADRDEFIDDLSDADFSRIYSAACRLNQEQGPDPKASVSSRLALAGDATSELPARLG